MVSRTDRVRQISQVHYRCYTLEQIQPGQARLRPAPKPVTHASRLFQSIRYRQPANLPRLSEAANLHSFALEQPAVLVVEWIDQNQQENGRHEPSCAEPALSETADHPDHDEALKECGLHTRDEPPEAFRREENIEEGLALQIVGVEIGLHSGDDHHERSELMNDIGHLQ